MVWLSSEIQIDAPKPSMNQITREPCKPVFNHIRRRTCLIFIVWPLRHELPDSGIRILVYDLFVTSLLSGRFQKICTLSGSVACLFWLFPNVQRLVKELFEGPEPEPAAGCSVSFTLMKHSAH